MGIQQMITGYFDWKAIAVRSTILRHNAIPPDSGSGRLLGHDHHAAVRQLAEQQPDLRDLHAGSEQRNDRPVAQMIEAGLQGYAIRLSPPNRITVDQVRGLDLPVLAIVAGASRMHDGAATAEVARTTLSHGTVPLRRRLARAQR